MPISIKGINTGVIRQKNEFIALALKIKETGNKESLFSSLLWVCETCLSHWRAGYMRNPCFAKMNFRPMKKPVPGPVRKCTRTSP